MTVYYRVLKVDDKEHSFIVRYWTDKITERSLRMRDDDYEDPPITCRTDFNLTPWEHDMTLDKLHEQIVKSAPKQWLELKEKALEGSTISMDNAKELININKECHLTIPPLNKGNQ